MSTENTAKGCKKTRLALLWMNLTSEPLTSLYTLLPFILRKDLAASTLQLSLFVTLRPVLSVFSFYWSSYISHRKHKLLSNLMGAWLFARLPFLLLPWIDNVWYLLFAAGVHQLFNSAGIPALIEILKRNIPKQPREKAYSFYYLLRFVESVVIGISIADILDGSGTSWRMLFFVSALIGLTSLFIQRRITPLEQEEPVPAPAPIKNYLLQPWKDCFSLLRSRPDFAQFQWGFMIGGFGLMLIAPALAVFYADVLFLSHAEIATARFVLMGIGVILSTLLWRRGIQEIAIPRLTAWILMGFALFPLTLLLTPLNRSCLYVAFFIYGVAQAGSHLLWNLSGTLFAQEQSSAPFSSTNILMVGLRGAVAPILGGLLCDLFGALPMLFIGAAISLYGAWFMLTKKHAQEA